MKSVQNALNRRKKGEKGFTLVELLVVVIIIGILAAVAVPIYLNQRKSAWRSSVESDVKNASLALETLSTENNGKIPTGVADTYGEGKTTLKGTDQEITVTKDNHITIAVSGNTYTITGWNSNLNDATATPTTGARTTYSSATGTLSSTN
ncbi:type IV pilin protein [Bifidobacterium thermophilum]|uniref:type IV pilin protein n=1 Tax=Bifidobacterium thermophilum TaxID=33905 RepID=UPI00399199DD